LIIIIIIIIIIMFLVIWTIMLCCTLDHGSRYNMVYVSNTFSIKIILFQGEWHEASQVKQEKKVDSMAIGTAKKYEINNITTVRQWHLIFEFEKKKH